MRSTLRSILMSPFCAAILLVSLTAWATSPSPPPDVRDALNQAARFRAQEAQRHAHLFEVLSRMEKEGTQPKQNLDIQHYDLDLQVDPTAKTIAGTVTMTFKPTKALSHLNMRLAPNLLVEEGRTDGAAKKVKRNQRDIVFSFNPPLHAHSTHAVSVQYGGSPETYGSQDGGMMFSTHGDDVPCAATLSEPFASASWWPCVEDVNDKFTMDLRLAVPEGMAGASNGALVSRERSDFGPVFHWREDFPLPNYLVSVNVTDYATFEETYTSLDNVTEMPVQNFVYPENANDAEYAFQVLPDMIHYYASLLGEYPFLSEKYGMVAFAWPGGMEHQTLTSMCDQFMSGDPVNNMGYAHELVHQWWGDAVTCRTWNDIWLNEGFATYFEFLWGSDAWGIPMQQFMDYSDDHEYDGLLAGTVYVKNGDEPFEDMDAVYTKGAWVMHMLRKVMGDEKFFPALHAYYSAHLYGNAATEDLQSACEAQYGSSLKWFFDQWVYTPYRPIYNISFTQGTGEVVVTLTQTQKHKITKRSAKRNVYIMPVDFQINFEDGSSEIVTVTNSKRTQTFHLPTSKPVLEVLLDPNGSILKIVE
jgi:aminopeptidase N